MANEIVKVYYPDSNGEQQFAYCETRGSFHQFVENVNSFIGRLDMDETAFLEGSAGQRYRMYWIDEDNDKVLIKCDYSLSIFLKRTNGVKKVYIVEKGSQEPQPKPQQEQQTQQQSPTSTAAPAPAAAPIISTHQGVQCDGCDVMPIVGFRYKCAQCYDYDLCENCERRKVHCEHVMYRFPIPLPRHTELNRRFFKKLRHSVSSRDSENERPRKCGRRRHESSPRCTNNTPNGAANAFSNFYAMMCDLSDGMDNQDLNAEPQANKTQANNVSTEAPNQPNNNQSANECPFMLGAIDPSYARAGVQALKGFSEVFGKLLDPLGIIVDVDVGLKTDKERAQSTKTASQDNAAQAENVENVATGTATNPEPTAPETHSSSGTQTPLIDLANSNTPAPSESVASVDISRKSSSDSSIIVNDGIRVFPSTSSTEEPLPQGQQVMEVDAEHNVALKKSSDVDEANKQRDSTPVESSWTLIGKQFDDLEINESDDGKQQAGTSTDAAASANASMPSAPVREVNYAQLSQDLLSHIQTEERTKSTQKAKAAALVVHHPDKKINNAVVAMMSMGFSNEGGWLTNLLDTVEGDIPRALELLHPTR